MPKFILASRSKARKKLLQQVGLRFTTTASRARESRRIVSSCGDLVMSNALGKANDVAKRRRAGIVIAADTVVMVGKRIIGKPRNLRDAFLTLKRLSVRPQWVYSGIAVIDCATGKTATDYEKTKVHMRRLTDRQIHAYFKKVSPLDKAGSFDIQGFGSIFIDRIEGCFYTVVGMPLAKLSKLLTKLGVDIF